MQPDRVAGFATLADAIDEALEFLEREICRHLESLGGFRGPVTKSQRAWSWKLDEIEEERQGPQR